MMMLIYITSSVADMPKTTQATSSEDKNVTNIGFSEPPKKRVRLSPQIPLPQTQVIAPPLAQIGSSIVNHPTIFSPQQNSFSTDPSDEDLSEAIVQCLGSLPFSIFTPPPSPTNDDNTVLNLDDILGNQSPMQSYKKN